MKNQARGGSAYKKGTTLMGNTHKQNTKSTENFPNQNMYGESDYKIKKDMRFEQDVDEQNFKRNISFRYIEIISFLCVLMNVKNIIYVLSDWHKNTLIHNSINVLNLTVTIFCLLIIKNFDKFVNNIIYIRILIEIDNILSTMMLPTTGHNLQYAIVVKYLVTFLYNLVFNLNLGESSIYFIIHTIVGFCLLENSPGESLFRRFFHNFFSMNGVNLISLAIFLILCQGALTLGNKQLWALYDSFKKSYFTLKNISDDLPFPIFVVNLKRQTVQPERLNQNSSSNCFYSFIILYKNSEAEKLNTKVKKIRDKTTKYSIPSTRLQKTDVNFKDLFEKSVEKLLDAEIEKCINNNLKHFDFPLIIGDNKLTWKQHPNFPTLFEGDLENIKWVRIILNPTIWKGQECLLIQMMENYDIQHSNFLDEYRGLLKYEFLKVIDNIDIICDKAPNRNKEKLELSKSPLLNNGSGSRCNNTGTITPDMLRSPNPLHPHFLKSPVILPNKLYASPQNVLQEQNDNKSSVHLSLNKPNPINNLSQIKRNYEHILKFAANKDNIVQTIDKKTNPTLNPLVPQANTIKTQFDYSLLFLLKNSMNYIYDMNLTINILNSLSVNIINTKLTQFHFENLIRYFISYFSPLLKVKNLRIDLFSEIDGEINAIYDYYRVIFFNVILFIINNIETKSTEQILQINVMHVRFSDEGSSFYEVTFNIHDENPKIPYPLVDQILSTFITTELRNTCIEKYKIVDIGLVVSSIIVNIVYNSELKFSSVGSNQHKITFLIHNHGGCSEEISFHKNFNRKKFEVEEKYYNKITERVFKKNSLSKPVKLHNESNVKSFMKKNTTVKNLEEDDKCKYKNFHILLIFYHKIILDEPEKEKGDSLSNDYNQYKEIHLYINNNFDTHDKILDVKNFDTTYEIIKKQSQKLNIIYRYISPSNPFKVKWDNSSTINNIKYNPIPRFLIVEVSPKDV